MDTQSLLAPFSQSSVDQKGPSFPLYSVLLELVFFFSTDCFVRRHQKSASKMLCNLVPKYQLSYLGDFMSCIKAKFIQKHILVMIMGICRYGPLTTKRGNQTFSAYLRWLRLIFCGAVPLKADGLFVKVGTQS